MVNMVKKDYNTGVTHFVFDQTSELNLLPRIGIRGQKNLNTIASTAQGSIATCTSTGDKYILRGDTNKWVKYVASSSSGGSTDEPTINTDDYERATQDDILSLFNGTYVPSGSSGGDGLATEQDIRDLFS